MTTLNTIPAEESTLLGRRRLRSLRLHVYEAGGAPVHRERASLVHRALRYQFAVYHDAPVLCGQNGLQPEERREGRRNERMAARGMDAGVTV